MEQGRGEDMVVEGESPMLKRNIPLILVNEVLGFLSF
jgi:hypothetical protein